MTIVASLVLLCSCGAVGSPRATTAPGNDTALATQVPAASPHVTGAALNATAVDKQIPAASVPGELIVEPDDGSGAIVHEVRAATTSIDFTMYLFTERDVIDALKQARSRGLRVRGMLEQHPYGSGPGNDHIFQEFKAAGIDMRWTNPAYKLTHEKALVIDGKESVILTLNLTHSAFTKNREFGIVDRSLADATEVEAVFDADWNRHSFSPGQADLVWSPVNARAKTIGLINTAATSLDIYEEEMQDTKSEEALTAAAKRGVRVRVVMPSIQGANDSNAAGVRRLQAGGVQVHGLDDPYIHAKAIVVDGATLFIGSENVSTSSLDENRETGIIVGNPEMIQRVRQAFDHDWSL